MVKTPPELIRDLAAIISLAELSEAEHDALVESARSSKPTSRLDTLAEIFYGVEEMLGDPVEVAQAVARLHRTGGTSQEILHLLLHNHIDEVSGHLGDAISDLVAEISVARAVALMETPLFVLYHAAFALRSADENRFEGVSAATDLRPAVNDDPSIGQIGIAAMLRRHRVRIAYVDGNGESKYFYVVLDDEDIAPFIGVLQTALDASILLQEFSDSHEIHDISLR